ncbi:DUF1190 domain-containing protein [Salmonella enterica subsp. salamae]|uniref:DUF1190 domain-containing protein n=1 Tax=Salmonella enterica subsp. salamae TaxID=59202 RepID=A0A5Y2S8Z9_SALER|nr:DUF1190 domain-containing protein [Salmonella enterica subsp. salamae]ECJ2312427.1 DUF1190 domain-containing protein [Salmonella enterica subsp. salamae]
MAKKRKYRSSYSEVTRMGGSVNPFERKRNRYTPKYLTLAIMGGAAFFLLKGCGDGGNSDNDGDGTFYSSVNDCIDDGNSASVCTDGWNNARTEFYANVPKHMTQNKCQEQFGDCYQDSTDRSWLPVLRGFLLSREIRQNRDERYIYRSGGLSYVSRPVWRTTSGNYAWRSGTGKSGSTVTRHSYTTRKASTVSRGGYGRSSSARGHWGG